MKQRSGLQVFDRILELKVVYGDHLQNARVSDETILNFSINLLKIKDFLIILALIFRMCGFVIFMKEL